MLLRACIVALIALSGAAQSGYRDRTEYDLVRAIRVQPDPRRRLELLTRWERRYPQSAFRQERFDLMLKAQQALGRSSDMWRTALRMYSADPTGDGAYWVAALGVALRRDSAGDVATVEAAARQLLARSAPGDQQTVAHRALGWGALCRGAWQEAETRFRIVLIRDAGDAEASFWMGVSLLARRDQDGLFHFARSLVVAGPGELTAADRNRVTQLLERAWMKRFGSRFGLERLYADARRGPLPHR